ncbi:hypothetical protein BSIN_3957 [Burkholderia singularis]|uniref:Uncharacterized protein n=1 Tax=Burkholderia singularis TaxID=1503053 RepID=A0A238H7C9_9BURK|nr:hypothetical protein BSIN_3957 [Burkholderia singularis]
MAKRRRPSLCSARVHRAQPPGSDGWYMRRSCRRIGSNTEQRREACAMLDGSYG